MKSNRSKAVALIAMIILVIFLFLLVLGYANRENVAPGDSEASWGSSWVISDREVAPLDTKQYYVQRLIEDDLYMHDGKAVVGWQRVCEIGLEGINFNSCNSWSPVGLEELGNLHSAATAGFMSDIWFDSYDVTVYRNGSDQYLRETIFIDNSYTAYSRDCKVEPGFQPTVGLDWKGCDSHWTRYVLNYLVDHPKANNPMNYTAYSTAVLPTPDKSMGYEVFRQTFIDLNGRIWWREARTGANGLAVGDWGSFDVITSMDVAGLNQPVFEGYNIVTFEKGKGQKFARQSLIDAKGSRGWWRETPVANSSINWDGVTWNETELINIIPQKPANVAQSYGEYAGFVITLPEFDIISPNVQMNSGQL